MGINTDIIRNSRSLIISYSYTGHTHKIAETIRDIVGADICEIYPRQPYPTVFLDLLAQVKKEIQTNRYPGLLPGSADPDLYQILFVGSPNWCGTLAPPLITWLSSFDLAGKTIIPFYSHCGGVPCDFQKDILKICPEADVKTALGIIESEHDYQDLISQWIEKTMGRLE